MKHSRARHVEIRITVADGGCELAIADDGVGIHEATMQDRRDEGHLGLTVLRDLASEAGAVLDIRAGDPRGTVVALRLQPVA